MAYDHHLSSRFGLAAGYGRRLLGPLGLSLLYLLVGAFLIRMFGPTIVSLAMLPVAASAWRGGLRAGILAGCLAIPVNMLLLHLAGYSGWTILFRESGGVSAVAPALVGGMTGYLRDLRERMREQMAEQLRVAEALRWSEARLQALVQTGSDVIFIIDLGGTIRYVSPSIEWVLGHAPVALLGTDGFALVHPDDAQSARAFLREHLEVEGYYPSLALRLRHGDGGWRHIEAVGNNLLDDPVVGGIVVNCRDITERARAETFVAGQSRILELIAQDAALPETLLALARLIETHMPDAMISIRVLEADGATLRCIAAPTMPPAFSQATVCIPVGPSVGSCGTAAFRGAPVIVDDIATDPLWAAYRDFAVGHGLRACWSIPVLAASHPTLETGTAPDVLGTFAMYYTTPCRPNDADWRVIERSVGLAAIAIERARVGAALRESAETFDSIWHAATDALVITEANRVVAVNQAYTALLGFTPADVVGSAAGTLAAPEDRPKVGAHIAAGYAGPYEIHHLRRDGSTLAVEIVGKAIRYQGRLARLASLRDITARRALEAQLRHRAFHDALTNLPNRARFLELLTHALAGPEPADSAVSVFFLDLDGFKVVNDSLGHEAGDRLLVEVAGRLRASLDPQSAVARFGGDEFAVLLATPCDARDVAHMAARLLEVVRVPCYLAGQEFHMAASVGIAHGRVGQAQPEDLLRQADIAMYRAKAAGKDRYAVFDPRMQAEVLDHLALESDLRRAVDHGEFALHYQPTVELATGRITGLEALVRWQHPEHGLLTPDAFIPVAEETGLILPLGRWVLWEACRQARTWHDAGLAQLGMAVNLSAREFESPALVAEIAQMLRETGLRPAALTLEITETAAMADPAVARRVLAGLKALGVRIAIDDFGTGYSSLGYLCDLPIDILKIDRRFVAGVERGAKEAAIVQAVLALAHALDLATVAEGIETSEQAARLRALGCGVGQGYYFGRSVPAGAVGVLLARQRYAGPAVAIVAD